MLWSLIDPNTAATRASPRDTRDLAIAANNSWVISLNNLGELKGRLSDTLYRLNAGEGFATRSLHTDEEECISVAKRPICLNGIEQVVTAPDLLDRSLLLTLPTIPPGSGGRSGSAGRISTPPAPASSGPCWTPWRSACTTCRTSSWPSRHG